MSDDRSETGQVLVALDGSSVARSAGELAVQVASSQGLTIRGLNMVSDRLVMSQYSNYQEELKRNPQLTSRPELVEQFIKQGNNALLWLGDRCREQNVPLTTDILFGGVPEMLLREAQHSILIAMGRRGYSHSNDPRHIGRNFRIIAQRAEVPVIAGGDEHKTAKRVLLAYNGTSKARKALQWVTRQQKTSFDQIVVVTVQPIRHASRRRLSKLQKELDASGLTRYEFISRRGRPAYRIALAAAESQSDLIVMGSYHHPILLEWLLGGTIKGVLRKTRLPVVLV